MVEWGATFGSLVVGESNEIAATAARRVAESPGAAYNPFVVHGPTGSGKSHLLGAIADAARDFDPDLNVHLASASALADRVTAAMALDGLTSLREALSGFDILLIDDLDELGGLQRTQSEVAGVLARMISERRQVVVASAVSPGELTGFDPDLRELLGGGLVADIALPDVPMRRAMVSRFLRDRVLSWPEETVEALAGYALDGETLRSVIDQLTTQTGPEDGPPLAADVDRLLQGESRETERDDEFGSFLEDVGRAVAAAVETDPWRRRIAEAILRWEGEGIRTSRLEQAFEADSPPDVDALLESFARDASRLLEIREELGPNAPRLDDPAAVDAAERLLAERKRRSSPGHRSSTPFPPPAEDRQPDLSFLDPRRVLLDFVDIDERLVEEPT